MEIGHVHPDTCPLMSDVTTVCCLYFGESDTNKCRRDAEQTKRASDEAVVSGLMSENIH